MPQFEVELNRSYFGTFRDNIVVGPTGPTLDDDGVTKRWQRHVSGSVTSGSFEFRAATSYADFLILSSSDTMGHKNGELRTMRLLSDTEIMADSVPPSPAEVYFLGDNPSNGIVKDSYRTNLGLQTYSFVFSMDGQKLTATDLSKIGNGDWWFRYPFERFYWSASPDTWPENDSTIADPGVRLMMTHRFDTSDVGSVNVINPYSPVAITTRYRQIMFVGTDTWFGEKRFFTTGDTDGFVDYSDNTFADSHQYGWFGASKRTRNFFMFGNKPKPKHIESVNVGGLNGDYVEYSAWNFIASGWKYGLVNATPTKTTCVWRSNRYGQFRDMLEQRPYTKSFGGPSLSGPLDADGGIRFIANNALTGERNDYEAATEYLGSDIEDAYTANPQCSGVVDKFYRSGRPWCDIDPRRKFLTP